MNINKGQTKYQIIAVRYDIILFFLVKSELQKIRIVIYFYQNLFLKFQLLAVANQPTAKS